MQPCDILSMRNETLNTISHRHSVRLFTKDDVSADEVNILLYAANAAPSAHNQQAWRFIILRGEKKQELAQLVTAQSVSFPRPAAALLRPSHERLSELRHPGALAAAGNAPSGGRPVHLRPTWRSVAAPVGRRSV